ncbi:MAG: hypothetical protein IT371_24870 [Deltaproteobacteria bacterium]|nr:hypothetical protein [Deltaproteobacteria bacterium]
MRWYFVAALCAGAAGCGINLGDAPFLCNRGSPQCPDGYECNKANVCVREGTCPQGVAGCEPKPDTGSVKPDGGSGQDGSGPGDGSTPTDGLVILPDTTVRPDKCVGRCDQGTPNKCGNGVCDQGETVLSCPADCKSTTCTAGETKCQDKSNLRFCENGAWKSSDCTTLCKGGGYDYATECTYSSKDAKDLCLCGKYAKFGELCNNDVKCNASLNLFCGSFGTTTTKGFCTKYCSNPNGICSGSPLGTEAQCILDVGGKDACGFICDLFVSCPTGLNCDVVSGLCKP